MSTRTLGTLLSVILAASPAAAAAQACVGVPLAARELSLSSAVTLDGGYAGTGLALAYNLPGNVAVGAAGGVMEEGPDAGLGFTSDPLTLIDLFATGGWHAGAHGVLEIPSRPVGFCVSMGAAYTTGDFLLQRIVVEDGERPDTLRDPVDGSFTGTRIPLRFSVGQTVETETPWTFTPSVGIGFYMHAVHYAGTVPDGLEINRTERLMGLEGFGSLTARVHRFLLHGGLELDVEAEIWAWMFGAGLVL